MAASKEEQIRTYGWTALSCDPKQWGGVQSFNNPPKPQLCADVPIPDTALAQKSMDYARKELPAPTFNHSMRVFYYGIAIANQQFPDWQFSSETWLLTCLFHDLGTIDKHTHGTLMSFEFYGGFLALNILKGYECPSAQAESVAEAIIRHQDPVEVCTIHTIGLLVQLATQYDNMGYRAGYIHADTIKDVIKHYPRKHWSKCFSKKIREEVAVKPWCHTTASEEKFPHDVEHNELMEPYDALE
ncbi:putative cyanamide hydratase [Plenodomus tracheiphilus IPT5]|uniref:Putative cyanamide hydratase n=1 Tax=Plenodomus tracheiphilus IPT5 TaxID=1408161 RepID=A0A6A7AQE8_9PLEO|nr:putative cyanamide hydratase [Plenodomus tracheiphilus IPT5]